MTWRAWQGSERIEVRVCGAERLVAYGDPTYLRTILETCSTTA